jgi:signal transduction histidine kinase/CheY-like chemotaxis protein
MQSATLLSTTNLSFVDVTESCFAANFIAYVVLTPLILIIYDQLGHYKNFDARSLRSFFLLLGFSALTYFVAVSPLPALFLIPLALMALAYTTNLGVVACGVLIAGLFILTSTVLGRGAIAHTAAAPSTHLLMLQFFLATITTSILPMAARMAEHRQLRESLIDARLDAEAANNAKSQFLATISHEIRTPLNGVLGMAQIMALGELDPVQKGRLNIIRRSGEVLLSILNDVLDLSKIEAGKLAIEMIDFDLAEVLRATTHAYGPLAEEKGLVFSQDLESISGVYRGDPTRIRQILTNLISNALKFTEAGEIEVSARFVADTLNLSVKDTGIGIAPEKLDKLFGKFTQADETTTRRFGGTGLGLSICRDLANLMGGTIVVESQEGRGSTFAASIPLVRVGDVEPAEPDQAALSEAFGEGVRVLAAEDNQTNQLVLRTLLEMVGYEVSIAGDGAEAVSKWEAEDWDVILMDVQMPVMDGRDAARAIRQREAATGRRRTPIIALTANTMAHQVEGYRADGMDGHVAKPIDAETLFQAVSDATNTAANRHQAA